MMKRTLIFLVILGFCTIAFSQIKGHKGFNVAMYHQSNYTNNDVCLPIIAFIRYEGIDFNEYFKIHNIWIKFKYNGFGYLMSYDPSYSGKDSINLYLYKIKDAMIIDSMLIAKCLPEVPTNKNSTGNVVFSTTEGWEWINGKKIPIIMTDEPAFGKESISLTGSYGNRWDNDKFGVPYKYIVKFQFTPDNSYFGFKCYVKITDEIYLVNRHSY
jgi:hypothetical protein